MTAYRVKSPVTTYTGAVGELVFVKGVYEGEVSDASMHYFDAAGYTVEKLSAARKADKAAADAEAAAQAEADASQAEADAAAQAEADAQAAAEAQAAADAANQNGATQ